MTIYGSLSEADTYFEDERLNSDLWFEEPETERTKALKQATRIVESLAYAGTKTVSTQELEFPRGGDLSIPANVIYAAYEIAFALLDGRDLEMEAEQAGEIATNFGMGSVRVDPYMTDQAKAHGVPSVVAWQYLRPYLIPGDQIIISRVD